MDEIAKSLQAKIAEANAKLATYDIDTLVATAKTDTIFGVLAQGELNRRTVPSEVSNG